MLFITGVLCVGMAYALILTTRLTSQISQMEEKMNSLYSHVHEIDNTIDEVEHKIEVVDKIHTQVEEELKKVISGEMKSSNRRLLKG
jgi:peptidoglycan hydrolase CwlO-like protein